MFNSRLRAFFFCWLPWHLYLVAIFIASSMSKPEEVLHMKIEDFLMHPLEYTLLPILTFQAFRNSNSEILKTRVIRMGILFCLFYAASDEFHQMFVPGRHADLVDWLYDLIGISAGTFLYLRFHGKQDSPVPA